MTRISMILLVSIGIFTTACGDKNLTITRESEELAAASSGYSNHFILDRYDADDSPGDSTF